MMLLARLWPLLLAAAFAGAARPVTPPYEGNCQSPTWSPDGSKLAYEVNYHQEKRIELYTYTPGRDPKVVRPVGAPGGSSLTAGFSGAGGEHVSHELSWSPAQMGLFVYSANNSSRDYDLYLSTGNPVAIASGADGGARWSPDGRWIVFTSGRTGQGDLYLIDVSDIAAPPRRLTTDATSAELYPAWSADSRSLVYVGRGQGGDTLLLIADLAAPRPRALASLARTQTRPSFSPDGQRIAFYSDHEAAGRFDLYAQPVQGGAPQVIARDVVLSHRGPSWTPDGRRLVYVKNDDDAYDPVWIAPVADPSAARPLRTDTVGNGDLDVARGTDGRTWLAVAAQGAAGDKSRDYKRIYVLPLPE